MHGMTTQDLIREVGSAIRGRNRQSTIRIAGEEVNYAVKLEGHRYIDVVQLKELLLPTPSGEMVRLSDVLLNDTLQERTVMGRVIRENQQYQRIVGYEFRGSNTLGDRVKNAVIKATTLPPGFSLAEDQGYFWSREEQQQIWGVLVFGVVLILMVTATLFESVRQP